MKECKCGRLSADFLDMQERIVDKLAKDVVEGVRTPDWVKNMLAGIPEQLSRAEYEILEEILKEKNRFMEEKKIKKMTKAEAFEWLKCKKVSVSTREISEKVQSKLFACGVIWKHGGTDFCDYGNYYVINSHGLLGHCDGMGPYWECLVNEEISADDILSIEIVEDTKPDCERNEHVKALQELIAKSGCIDCIIISKNDIGILKK